MRNKAFTLIELMVSLALVLILIFLPETRGRELEQTAVVTR